MRKRQLQSFAAISPSPKRPGQRCPTMAGSLSPGAKSQPIPPLVCNSIPLILLVLTVKPHSHKSQTFRARFSDCWWRTLASESRTFTFMLQISTFTFQTVGGQPKPASLCHLLPFLPLGSPCQPLSHTIVIKVIKCLS